MEAQARWLGPWGLWGGGLAVGAGLWGTVGIGSLTGVVAGQYGRIAQLALSGQWAQASQTLFRPGDMLLDAVTGGLGSAAGYGIGQFLRKAGQSIDDLARAGNYCSFSEDTPVSTEDGQKPISELEVGDKVLAYNEETGETGYYPVTATWFHDDPVILHLTIDGETLATTPEHPFFTADGKWVAAEALQISAQFRKANGRFGAVENIEIEPRVQAMYTLTVAIAHTYFVGEGAWLVHNACGLIGNKAVSEIAGSKNISPGRQNSLNKSYVEQFAQDMLNGNFNWNNMGHLMEFALNPDGTFVLLEGHHRFLAAQLTNTPIPWNNPRAVIIHEFPVNWPSSTWANYFWDP